MVGRALLASPLPNECWKQPYLSFQLLRWAIRLWMTVFKWYYTGGENHLALYTTCSFNSAALKLSFLSKSLSHRNTLPTSTANIRSCAASSDTPSSPASQAPSSMRVCNVVRSGSISSCEHSNMLSRSRPMI